MMKCNYCGEEHAHDLICDAMFKHHAYSFSKEDVSEHDDLLARLDGASVLFEKFLLSARLARSDSTLFADAAATIRSLQAQLNDCVEGVLRADTEAIWQQVISACALAWPEQEKLFYSASPTELIERIIAERDAERKARERVETLHKGLMQEVEKRAESAERRLAEVEQDANYWNNITEVDSIDLMEAILDSHDGHSLRGNLVKVIDAAIKESAAQEKGK